MFEASSCEIVGDVGYNYKLVDFSILSRAPFSSALTDVALVSDDVNWCSWQVSDCYHWSTCAQTVIAPWEPMHGLTIQCITQSRTKEEPKELTLMLPVQQGPN